MQANSEYDRTILVSGLPEGVRESTVLIHFQKKRNGGGDIEKITLLAGGKAMVVFENPKGLLKLVVFQISYFLISSVHPMTHSESELNLSSMITCSRDCDIYNMHIKVLLNNV